jgi:hypothetical protein
MAHHSNATYPEKYHSRAEAKSPELQAAILQKPEDSAKEGMK